MKCPHCPACSGIRQPWVVFKSGSGCPARIVGLRGGFQPSGTCCHGPSRFEDSRDPRAGCDDHHLAQQAAGQGLSGQNPGPVRNGGAGRKGKKRDNTKQIRLNLVLEKVNHLPRPRALPLPRHSPCGCTFANSRQLPHQIAKPNTICKFVDRKSAKSANFLRPSAASPANTLVGTGLAAYPNVNGCEEAHHGIQRRV